MAESFFQEDEILGRAYDTRLMRRLWGAIRPFRRIFFAALALALLAVGNDLLGPFITQLAVDRYIAPRAPVTLSPAQRIAVARVLRPQSCRPADDAHH